MSDQVAEGDVARAIVECEADEKDELTDDEVRAAYAGYLSEGTATDAIGRSLCRIALGERCVGDTEWADADGGPLLRYPTAAERWWARRRLRLTWRRDVPAGRVRWDTLAGAQIVEMLSWSDEAVRREAVVAARGGHVVGAARAEQALRVLARAWNERQDAASRAVGISLAWSGLLSPSEPSTVEGGIDPARAPRCVRLTRIIVSDPDLDRISVSAVLVGDRTVETARDGSRVLLLPDPPVLARGERVRLVVSAVGPAPVLGLAAVAVGEVILP